MFLIQNMSDDYTMQANSASGLFLLFKLFFYTKSFRMDYFTVQKERLAGRSSGNFL